MVLTVKRQTNERNRLNDELDELRVNPGGTLGAIMKRRDSNLL